MSVTFDDVNAMADIMGALDDVDSGRAEAQVAEAVRTGDTSSLNDSQRDVAAMKNILGNLYDVAGDDLAPQPATVESFQPQQNPYNMMQEDMSYEEYLAMTQGKQLQSVDVSTGQPAVHQPIANGPEWVLVTEEFNGVKSLHNYSIKHNTTGKRILDNIALKESASSVCNMLNQGKTFSDPKILGLVSSGIQYTTIVESMVKSMKQRRKVLRESNYSAAQECDKTIQAMKLKASTIKSDLQIYIAKHGINN